MQFIVFSAAIPMACRSTDEGRPCSHAATHGPQGGGEIRPVVCQRHADDGHLLARGVPHPLLPTGERRCRAPRCDARAVYARESDPVFCETHAMIGMRLQP